MIKKAKVERDIDLVYLWVDGNDPKWLSDKLEFIGEQNNSDDSNCTARFVDNDELKYSLRSVEKNLPWVRNIFIVTYNQIPVWLNTENSKIKIIDHKEILPPQAIPCYNSIVIEHFLYKIPGLSEYFLYANDDMFVGQPLEKSFFFTQNGLPIIRLCQNKFGKISLRFKRTFNLHISIHQQTIARSADLIKKRFRKYYSGTSHHNIDAYLKSDYKKVEEEIFHKEIFPTIINHLRKENDVQRIIVSYYALSVNRGYLKYVDRKESCRIRVHKRDFVKYINRYSPKLFCLNDNEHATENDRKRIKPFREKLFPEKSVFEK